MIATTFYVGSTFFKFKVSKAGILENNISIRKLMSAFLSFDFDAKAQQWVLARKYLYYNENTGELHLPRHALEYIKESFLKLGIEVNVVLLPPTPYKEVAIKMNPKWIPRHNQIAAIDYLSAEDSTDPIRGIALQTGQGKTFSLNYALSKLGRRAIIYVGGLTEQWRKAILEQTLLKKEDIYIITGSASVQKLLWQIDKKLKPKVIIASISTMRNYMNGGEMYRNTPAFEKFHEICKIGVRVIDEVHLNFHSNLLMDLQCNVASTLVSTATFSRTDPVGKWVFDLTYPHRIRFGSGSYKRYVDIYDVTYRLGYGMTNPRLFKTPSGYNHSKYENWLLHKISRFGQIFREVWFPLIEGFYLNKKKPGQKLLVLVATHEMGYTLVSNLRGRCPDLIVDLFIGSSEDAVLDYADIIVSTPGSGGTGRDIQNLKTTLLTIAIGSQPLNEQILGRLRELKDDDTPIFVFVSDKGVSKHMDYRQVRRELFYPKAKNYHTVDM